MTLPEELVPTPLEAQEGPRAAIKAAAVALEQLWGSLSDEGARSHVAPFRAARASLQDALRSFDQGLEQANRELAPKRAQMYADAVGGEVKS